MPPSLRTASEPLGFERRQSICRRRLPVAGSVPSYRGQAAGDGVKAIKKLCCYSSERMGVQGIDPVLENLATGKLSRSEAQSN